MAEWLRLQPKLHQASGLPAQHVQESAHGVQTGEHALLLRMEPAVGGGERADGQPVCVFIPDAGQDAEQVAGVFKTFRRGPVRLENVFLHPLAVKVPVGKAVEGFHARVVFVQPCFQGFHGVRRFQQFRCRPGGQAQADAQGAVLQGGIQCGQFLPDAGNVGLEGFPGFRPGFGGMDVGAVGKHGGAVCAVLGNGVPLRGKMVENACAWDVPQAYIRFRSEEKFHGIAAFGVIRKRPFRRKEWL